MAGSDPFGGEMRQASCVAIDGRALLIEGPPGSGKSTLALLLIDRGAELVGDDGVLLAVVDGTLRARAHRRTRGLIEVRNLGLLPFPHRDEAPVALLVTLDPAAPRYIEQPGTCVIAGIAIPQIRLWPNVGALALKAELALRRFGLGSG